VKEALKALKDGRPRLVRISTTSAGEEGVVAYNMSCHSGGTLEVYIEPVLPKPHILIVGRSPVGLARFAKTINYTVTVAAPGADHASYPDADHVVPDLNLGGLKITTRMFIVVSTQGDQDEEALEQALRTNASYVAFVASKTKAARVIEFLEERGIDRARLGEVRAPAGLNIQARSQEEIALSILAEIVQLSRNQPAEERAPAMAPEKRIEARDPICGMTVDMARAQHTADFAGRRFYFCCAGCKQVFDKQPEKYIVADLAT
jgi:xanthine dehydrogenase accessory factor